MSAFLQVGLVGVLLSSCSAAGMWRVRDLAGLGRDDLFSGLRYALSCIRTTHKSIKQAQSIIVHGLFPANLLIPSFFPQSLYLLCQFIWQRGSAETRRGRADLTELRLQKRAPFKATGRARPKGMGIGCPALDSHL